jgi:hypothetical protein
LYRNKQSKTDLELVGCIHSTAIKSTTQNSLIKTITNYNKGIFCTTNESATIVNSIIANLFSDLNAPSTLKQAQTTDKSFVSQSIEEIESQLLLTFNIESIIEAASCFTR